MCIHVYIYVCVFFSCHSGAPPIQSDTITTAREKSQHFSGLELTARTGTVEWTFHPLLLLCGVGVWVGYSNPEKDRNVTDKW